VVRHKARQVVLAGAGTTDSARRSASAAAADLGADWPRPAAATSGADDGQVLYRYFSSLADRARSPPPVQRPGFLRHHPGPGPGRAPGGPPEHRGPQGQRGERHRGLPSVPGPVVPGPGGLGHLPLPGDDGRLAGRHGIARQLLPRARAPAVRLRARSRRGEWRPAAGSSQPHQRGDLRGPRGGRRQGGHDLAGLGRRPRRPLPEPEQVQALQAPSPRRAPP
jgi:hypothetical protein